MRRLMSDVKDEFLRTAEEGLKETAETLKETAGNLYQAGQKVLERRKEEKSRKSRPPAVTFELIGKPIFVIPRSEATWASVIRTMRICIKSGNLTF